MSIVAQPYLPKYFSQKSIYAFLGIILICFLTFSANKISFQYVAFNCVEAIGFFYFLTSITRKWKAISSKVFQKKLFYLAFGIRVVWVIFSYYYFIAATNIPFEYEAGDSIGYHGEAKWLASLLYFQRYREYREYVGENFSDMGYPFYLGLIYYVLGDGVLFPRVLKSLMSSFMCLLIYRIGRNNFGEKVGRMAGIMAMLVPNLIYYCGLHVKETEMVFLTVCFVYLADKLLRNSTVKPWDIVLLMLLAGSLFFFRTVLACSLIGSIALATALVSSRNSSLGRRSVLVILLVIGAYAIVSTPVINNINEYLKERDENLSSQMNNFSTRQDGSNKFAKYGSRSVFLPLMLMAPFPTLVDTNQPNAMMLGGAFFTRNVYAFFVFIALFTLYKRKELRNHVFLLLVIASYIFVLASSGFALSERFHLPLVPFLLIFAAYGISEVNKKNKKYYIPYLLFISIIIIGWNWFKLAGRS